MLEAVYCARSLLINQPAQAGNKSRAERCLTIRRRGSQYAAGDYRDILQTAAIIQSTPQGKLLE
jgi:hypothetical protein